MPNELPPIPPNVAITEPETGFMTFFFRQIWELVRTGFQRAPTVASIEIADENEAVVTSLAWLALADGEYRVSWRLRKIVADGVSSSLTVTIGWLDGGVAISQAFPALTTDTVVAQSSGSLVLHADGASQITYAIAYASNTPNKMHFNAAILTEQMG